MKIKKLLASILALAMVLSTMGMVVFADDGNVAQIGDTSYATLDEAVRAAKADDTITLLADAELYYTNESAYDPANTVNVKEIDLNGHTMTITREGDFRFGNTTIKNGDIVVDSVVGEKIGNGVFYMFDDNVLTLDNVKLTAEKLNCYSIFSMENNSGLKLQNGTEVIVTDCTLDAIIAAVSEGENIIEDSKITATNLKGRGFMNGNYTVKGDSEITMTGVTKDGFYISEGDTLKILDTAKVNITLNADRDDRLGININEGGTYNKANTATVTAESNAIADVIAAKITSGGNDTYYTTLTEAFAAINDGDTVTIFEGTYTEDVSFYKDNVTVVGQGDVTIKGHLEIGQTGTATRVAEYFNIQNIDVEAESGRAVRIYGSGVLTECNFKSEKDAVSGSYAKAEGSSQVIFNNCTFDAKETALHFDGLYANKFQVNGGTVKGEVALASGTPVEFSNVVFEAGRGGEETDSINFWGDATLTGCTFAPSTKITSKNSSKLVLINDCTVSDGSDVFALLNKESKGGIVVDGSKAVNRVAKIGDTYYTALRDAVDAIGSNAGEYVIKVLTDIVEDVTVTQYANQEITIEGDETEKPVINGTISVNGRSNAEEGEALVIKNIAFDAAGVSKDRLIGVYDGGTRYARNVTVENCDFYDNSGTINENVAAIKESTGGSSNWKIINCTASGIHSLTQLKNVAKVTISGCEITNCKNGIHLGNSNNVSVTDTTVETNGYGLRAGNSGNTDKMVIELSGNNINAGEQAIYLREGSTGAELSITSGSYMGGAEFAAVESEENAKVAISGGHYSSNVDAYLVDGFELTRTGNGYLVVEDKTAGDEGKAQADSISIEYKDVTVEGTEGEKTYEIVVKANDEDKINELASVDLSFAFTTNPVTGGAMDITVAPASDFTMTRYENTNRYMFNYNGVDAYEDTANAITVGTITVTGYGKYTIATADVATNVVNATTLYDNLVDSYTAAGATDDDSTTGALIINSKITDGDIAVPTRTLTVNVTFPNVVNDNAVAYQNMTVEITGNIDGVNKTVTYNLGTGSDAVAMTNGGAYVVTEDKLVLNNAYTVTVKGAGYRTARYTVTMTGNKTLNFWNNVMDNELEVEEGKATSALTKNFLAGDIVGDNNINIYDLSAVVSYFGTSAENKAEAWEKVKYDLNRDGVIDSKDVAYVLVSWGE